MEANADSINKQQPTGYKTREIIMDHWCRNCTAVSFINDDIKCMIQLYSYPIPFDELHPLLSYKIMMKQNKDNKVYCFEKIDTFSYRVSNEENRNDIIYHPLQPIIPSVLRAKSTVFSDIGESSIAFTKLRLVLRPKFGKGGVVQYRYNGKNKEEIPEIWRCANGKETETIDIVGYDLHAHSVHFKNNLGHFMQNDNILSLNHFDRLQQYIHNGISVNALKLLVYSAPLRLPNEKYVCVISVVDDIIIQHP